MTRWSRGEADIERLVATGELQQVVGASADGAPLLAKARRTLLSARGLAATDTDSAYVLAYDAARQALTALLQQQGLRPTGRGGHVAVESAVVAQFGDGLRSFGTLRRRRHELEYPQVVGDAASEREVLDAVDDADALIGVAERLLGELGLF